MKKRILSLFLAASVVFFVIADCTPKAKAVLPAAFVESAFASYAMSSGYSFVSDEMDDNIFLGLFRELYNDYRTVMDAAGQTIRSFDEYTSHDVYIDSSGNIVVSYGVAQDWSVAMAWIQSHYNIEAGSSPVTVVQPSGSSWEIVTDSSGLNNYLKVSAESDAIVTISNNNQAWPVPYYLNTNPIGYYNGISDNPMYMGSGDPSYTYYLTLSRNPGDSNRWYLYVFCGDASYVSGMTALEMNTQRLTYNYYNGSGYTRFNDDFPWGNNWVSRYAQGLQDTAFSNIPRSSSPPAASFDPRSLGSSAAGGLAASIGSQVFDLTQGATVDDSIVIGVGAVPGTTEGALADIVADGIRADTLTPSATVIATDVIDTPVQPYPDVESLGLPSLGAALVSRFPFCIPWDFADIVGLLSAEPEPPNIRIDLFTAGFKSKVGITGDTSFSLDLGTQQYSKIGVFCRWGSLISFLFFLALLTKRMVWTA